MSHRNAPLSFEGRLRLVQRCQQRPISHVGAEMGISRPCASKWVNRWRRHGELGLHDRPSTPHHSPDATPAWVIEGIETWRREKKWSANRITHELADLDFRINRRTVTRHLTRLGLGQRRFIDPSGHRNRKPGKIIPAGIIRTATLSCARGSRATMVDVNQPARLVAAWRSSRPEPHSAWKRRPGSTTRRTRPSSTSRTFAAWRRPRRLRVGLSELGGWPRLRASLSHLQCHLQNSEEVR